MSLRVFVEEEGGKIVVFLENPESGRGRFRVRDDLRTIEAARKFAEEMQRAIDNNQQTGEL